MSSKKITSIGDVWSKNTVKVFVFVIEAKGLASSSKDGTSDPVVKVTMGKTTLKGKAQKKVVDPVFSDLLFFCDPDDNNCRLEINCSKKGKFLGQVDLFHLDTIADEKIHDLWLDLQPRPKKKKEVVTGKVHVRAYFSKVRETRPADHVGYKAFFHNYIGQFKTGDVIMYSGIGLLPSLTKVMTGCPYSHCGVVVEMPNRWTKLPELYVVEVFRNPGNQLDVFTDRARHDINIFRLYERFYHFYGTQLWYCPLKEQMSATGVAGIIDYIQTAHSNSQDLWESVTSFDSNLHNWIGTMFGAKYFQNPSDFADFYSGSFITECLRIAELVPNGTTKASSPLKVSSYPCFAEPLLIRPHDANELGRLQKGQQSMSSTAVTSNAGDYKSPSEPSWNMNLPTIRPVGGSSASVGKSSFVSEGSGGMKDVVLRIFFEGFQDLTMATMAFSDGTTAGDFREAIAAKKQLDPKNMQIFECMNNMETLLENSDMLNINAARNQEFKYQIKVRFDYKPEESTGELYDGAEFQNPAFQAPSVNPMAAGPSTAVAIDPNRPPPARKMIVPELSYVDIVKHEKLGSGAFGSVWRVGLEGFTCAMKVLSLSESTDVYDVESFKMETEILEKANHKNIVRYLGHEFKDTQMCLFLEFVPHSLRGLLDKLKPEDVTPPKCKKLIIEIAKGINYLHNMTPPIIHRDIKSANILCTRDAQGCPEAAKICDFGVSKLVDRDNQASTFVGTMAFMAPEIRAGRGKKVYTTAVDIYSFGIVVWEILTLQMPHKISKRPDWSGPEFNPLYDLQATLCRSNPSQRPTAAQIVQALALMYND
mmetsp:Transcript_28591/g.79906  ORF Transcript_28591/g.79906 Transcript_28591/m.79906 type:complete len:818 (+) Transcript_28591:47-2500(+)|eukprot:CAMPEP_0119156990 /NCGR_PEP_ID=MMETSP1310-20130426/52532_1 /TAXON_ID=464262 /ORGANISM="Genus nov. species nov., Strain RCC2339" /LENGTH=817 /DNA_ID=CAMNT_0007149605 /DNA_START=55 /DNA_END=2508 /DNA_ORIENTATION=+